MYSLSFIALIVLDDIQYNKIISGVIIIIIIIIQMKDEKIVTKFLKKTFCKYYTRVVKLKEDNCKAMELQIKQFYHKTDDIYETSK